MIQEKSCGAVVFADRAGERLYLIEHMALGHFALCKGHVEGHETEEETTRREIQEETGLSVTLIPGFQARTSYSPSEDHEKQVVYFLASTDSMQTAPQLEEVTDIQFLTLEDALHVLTYESDKEILRCADQFLTQRRNDQKEKVVYEC